LATQINIESSWIDNSDSIYPRVVTLSVEFDLTFVYKTAFYETIGEYMRDHIQYILSDDLGIEIDTDYIFDYNHNLDMHDSKWKIRPDSELQFMLKLRDEQHFTMMKLHYNN